MKKRSEAKGVAVSPIKKAIVFCLVVSGALLGLLATNNAVVQTCTPPPSNMISWWPGDGNANDIVGSNEGTVLGGVNFGSGKVDQAFSFDGTTGEIAITHTPALNFGPNDSFTVDAWLKPSPSVLGTGRAAVSLTYVCSPEAITLGLLTDGRLDFGIRDSNNIGVDVVSPGSIVDGQWHHVAGVRDVGSHTVKFYLDGSLVDSLPDTTTGTFTRADAQDRIGSIPVACPTNRYFWDGEIDEVEVFNRALSTSEIQAIVNAGSAGKCRTCTPPPPDMISWWPGDGNPNDIQDGNNGTLEGAVTFAPGKVDQAFSFNGVNGGGGVNLGDVAAFDFTPTSSFTMEAWVNSFGLTDSNVQDTQFIMALNYQCSNTVQALAIQNTTGNAYFAVRDDNGVGIFVLSPSPLSSNTFHHVAGVREVTGSGKTVKLYVDGVLVATAPDLSTGTLARNTPDFIGRRFPCTDTGTFNGLIDEPAIYNRALSDAEIQAIANAGGAGKCKQNPNSPPVANSQSVTTNEDTAKAITLTGTDLNGDALTYTVTSQPTHGALSGTAPNVTYTPNADYNGGDSFAFKVNDGQIDSPEATVSITVSPLNDAPVADSQSVTTNEDTAKAVVLTGSDVDGDALTYTLASNPSHGTLTGTAPNLTYSPAANYNGTDSFTFKVNDGAANSGVATVSIMVSAVNDAPVANGQSVTTPQNVAKPITLTGSDIDGDALTYAIVSSPSHGSLSGAPPNVTYTPATDYTGSDSFTFKVNDGHVDSAPATVSITVSAGYNFSGFFQPVDNLPTFNMTKAGSAIPVKFSLGGNQGLDILAAGYPKSQTIPCDSTAPVDGIEQTVAAGGSSLSYDSTSGLYTYVWKTDKSWVGTCRQLVVTLKDGAAHRANFTFK